MQAPRRKSYARNSIYTVSTAGSRIRNIIYKATSLGQKVLSKEIPTMRCNSVTARILSNGIHCDWHSSSCPGKYLG